MEKYITIIISVLLALSLCACSSNTATNVSMYDLNKAITEKAKFSDMQYASSSDENPEEIFENISNMSYSKVKAFFISYATNGTGNADEVAVIQVKNKKDVTEALSTLNSHLEFRKSLYNNYDKSQLEKLNNAIVTSKNDFAIIIVSDNPDVIKTAFFNYIQ